MTRWLWRKCPTRSHSELGRESLQRRWYFVLRHGRVGRCLVFRIRQQRRQNLVISFRSYPVCFRQGLLFKKKEAFIKQGRPSSGAGWSSPVARQAHNLKVAGSNPAPATKHSNIPVIYKDAVLRGCVFFCVLALLLVAIHR